MVCTTLPVFGNAADEPEIRVGVSQDFRPYAFADKNGRPVGYYPTAAFQGLPALMYRPKLGHSIWQYPIVRTNAKNAYANRIFGSRAVAPHDP